MNKLNMPIVITGTSSGVGLHTAMRFCTEKDFTVFGIDLLPCPEALLSYDNYHHYQADVRNINELPDIENSYILINNAGVQNTEDDISTNLYGVINCTEKYGLQSNIHSICNLASVSAHNGAEYGRYCASKGGVLSYTKWTAKQIAPYGATCNSLSFGGIMTHLNDNIIEDSEKWHKVMDMTPLKRWANPAECANWIYFITVLNKSCSGQDIIIDNLEMLNHTFVE